MSVDCLRSIQINISMRLKIARGIEVENKGFWPLQTVTSKTNKLGEMKRNLIIKYNVVMTSMEPIRPLILLQCSSVLMLVNLQL